MKGELLVAAALISACAFAADVPLPEHPRPDWERTEWMDLNGEWDFGFAPGKSDRKIAVPFGWGCKLSGVADEGDAGYCRRSATVPAAGDVFRAELGAKRKNGKVTVRLEADHGLAVHGPQFGRYAFGPEVE